MTWIVFAVLLVLAAGVVAAVVKTRFRWGARPPAWERAPSRPRCLKCRGTGWLNRGPERTLNVIGEGFEDRHTPATICPACGGTGMAPER
jgi:hypothetical protein